MSEDRLKVMQIISNLDIGGAQEVVRTLVEYLMEAGCDPVVCTLEDGPLRQDIERLGVPVEVLPGRRYSIVAFPLFLLDMWRIRRLLAGTVRKHQVDVIQTHLLQSLDFLTLTLRWDTGVRKIFWTVHNYNFTLQKRQLERHKWLLKPKRLGHRILYRLGARNIDGFIAVSEDVEVSIVENIGPVSERIYVINNGVDVRRYRRSADKAAMRRQLGLPDDAPTLIVVGTLKKQKGHHYLIEALPAILDRFPELHILLVGDGELRDELLTQVEQAGLNGNVHFLGNRSDVPELLASSDYFVLPSLWEGLPMALIEAMASGLPIVATDVSGSRQVMVPDETGLLIPPGDTQQLSQALVKLLSYPARSRAMGAAAQSRVEELFSAKKQAQEHIALYTNGLGAGNH